MKIIVPRSDLKFRAYKSSGPGGQHRNKTMSAIEVTHLPTGIKACASLKSQHQSKRAALRVLKARLYAHFQPEPERFRVPNERIRTYHEPDNRVTDHASGLQMAYRAVVTKNWIAPMVEARALAKLRGQRKNHWCPRPPFTETSSAPESHAALRAGTFGSAYAPRERGSEWRRPRFREMGTLAPAGNSSAPGESENRGPQTPRSCLPASASRSPNHPSVTPKS